MAGPAPPSSVPGGKLLGFDQVLGRIQLQLQLSAEEQDVISHQNAVLSRQQWACGDLGKLERTRQCKFC